MITHTFSLDAADGALLHGFLIAPEHPDSVLVIAHGMAEHAGRYQPLAQWLAARGVAVIACNHRGHGPEEPIDTLGHYDDHNGWQKVTDDLHQVLQHARRLYPERPVRLLGHSMGSFIAQSVAQQYPDSLDALILSATNRIHRPELVPSRLLVGLIRAFRGRRYRSPLIASLTFGKFNRAFAPARTDHDWLSRDPDQVDRYLADPHCGFLCTAGLWYDFLGGMLAIRPEWWRRDLPVHLFGGSRDPVGEMGRGLRAHFQAIRDAGVQSVTLRLFDGGRHEMLSETNALDVWQYLAGLCQARPNSTDSGPVGAAAPPANGVAY